MFYGKNGKKDLVDWRRDNHTDNCDDPSKRKINNLEEPLNEILSSYGYGDRFSSFAEQYPDLYPARILTHSIISDMR
jgi:hypothetical protein